MARSPARLAEATAALEEAVAKGYGPETPMPSARKAMKWLYAKGATQAEIAKLFDVSAETVRMAVLDKATRLLTEPEWQLVQWVRAAKLSPASVQAALERSRQGRRSDEREKPAVQHQAPA